MVKIKKLKGILLIKRTIISKSNGESDGYGELKKLKWGDLWRFGFRIPNKFRKERKGSKRLF